MISVHIVSYNKSGHAINAVQSVLNQKLGYGRYEILLLECGSDLANIRKFWEYFNSLRPIDSLSIRYFCGLGNLGLSAGLNFLGHVSHTDTTYIVQLNEDMFFAPNAVENLIAALQSNPSLGLACSNMINGGLYDRSEPKVEDVEDFARRYTDSEPMKLGMDASNLPWAISINFYRALSTFDVWTTPHRFNKYPGIWDESIDPFGMGWSADWDIHNRVIGIGRHPAIVENAHVYHYDHTSGSFLDQNIPDWTWSATTNYKTKYGSFEKGLPIVRRERPDTYPIGTLAGEQHHKRILAGY